MIFGQSAESVILSKAAQDDTVAKSVSLGKAARDVTGSLIGTSCYGGRAIRAGGRPRPTLEAARDGVEVRIDEPRPPHNKGATLKPTYKSSLGQPLFSLVFGLH